MRQETPPRDPAPAGADSENALAGRLGDYVQTARGALSDNTERAVKADLGIYAAWCGEYGLAALPASAETIAAFVDAMARTRAPATLREWTGSAPWHGSQDALPRPVSGR